MTPDKARRLLDGTTPGPWEVDHDHAWEPGVWSPDSIIFGPYYDRWDMEQWEAGTPEDLRLAAAAPTLAAMRAEMHEEWIGQYLDHDGKWATICAYPTRKEVARHLDYLSWDAYTHTRITRRYVTEPEVIE